MIAPGSKFLIKMTAFLVAAVMTLGLAGCATNIVGRDEVNGKAGKHRVDDLRTDLTPLVRRYEELENVESAHWTAGSMGDPRVPGPGLKWIDVVAVVPQEDFDELASVATAPISLPSDFTKEFVPFIPEGQLLTSSELGQMFLGRPADTPGKSASSQICIVEGTQTVVIWTLFE